MTRNRDVADTQDNIGGAVAPFVAGKNAIINGGMDIWQRGTTFSSFGSTSVYTADRWYNYRNSLLSGMTVSRQATGDSTNLPNIQYCMRIQRDSGNTLTSALVMLSDVETINSIPFAGKTAVFSFYARKGANFSQASSVIGFQVASGTGTDQSLRSGYTGQVLVANTSATLTTTWQRFTISFAVPSTSTQLGLVFFYDPTGTAGANDYYEITGVQLEIGSQATPFARAGGSIGGELALCQRYYFRQTNSTFNLPFANGLASGVTTAVTWVNFPVPMRISPTALEQTGTAGDYRMLIATGGDVNCSGVPTFLANTTNLMGAATTTVAAGLVGGNFTQLRSTAANAYLGWSAEL